MDLRENLNLLCDRYFFRERAICAKTIIYWIFKHPNLYIQDNTEERRFHLHRNKLLYDTLPTLDFIEYLCYVLPEDNKLETRQPEFDAVTNLLLLLGAPRNIFSSV